MKVAYYLGHPEPIIRDYPVYDSSAIREGSLLQLGITDPDSGTDYGQSLVLAYASGTAGNQATNYVGIAVETLTSFTATWLPSKSPDYCQVDINPSAVYSIEVSTGASDDVAITSTSGTTVTIGSLTDDIDGAWIYFPTTQTGVKGSLRYLTASGSGSATMASALSVSGDSSDTAVVFSAPLKPASCLDATARKLVFGVGGTLKSPIGLTRSIVIENKMEGLNTANQNLEPKTMYAMNNLHLQNVKFFQNVRFTNHFSQYIGS